MIPPYFKLYCLCWYGQYTRKGLRSKRENLKDFFKEELVKSPSCGSRI